MKRFVTLLSSLALLAGCRSGPGSAELYQSYISSVGTEAIVLRNLDRDRPLKAHEFATMELSFRLDDLRRLANSVDAERRETAVNLAHLILKNASEHREQLAKDRYSLEMVMACKNLVTSAEDIDRASKLAEYLRASSTNQVVYPKDEP